MASVGYDLYCQMVNEAVLEASGVQEVATIEIRVEMPVDAYLPENYVARSDLRLEAYRKLASAGETPDPSKVEETQALHAKETEEGGQKEEASRERCRPTWHSRDRRGVRFPER